LTLQEHFLKGVEVDLVIIRFFGAFFGRGFAFDLLIIFITFCGLLLLDMGTFLFFAGFDGGGVEDEV